MRNVSMMMMMIYLESKNMNTVRKLQKSIERIETELDKIIVVSRNDGL